MTTGLNLILSAGLLAVESYAYYKNPTRGRAIILPAFLLHVVLYVFLFLVALNNQETPDILREASGWVRTYTLVVLFLLPRICRSGKWKLF